MHNAKQSYAGKRLVCHNRLALYSERTLHLDSSSEDFVHLSFLWSLPGVVSFSKKINLKSCNVSFSPVHKLISTNQVKGFPLSTSGDQNPKLLGHGFQDWIRVITQLLHMQNGITRTRKQRVKTRVLNWNVWVKPNAPNVQSVLDLDECLEPLGQSLEFNHRV